VVLVARKTWCCGGRKGERTNGGDSFFHDEERDWEVETAGDVKEEGEGRGRRGRGREK